MKRYIFIIAALTALIFSGCSNDDDRPVKTPIDPLTDIYGVVTDNQGNRLQGIVVSDGYTCTATDENGVYQLTAGEFSYHVYLSIPAAYEVPVSEGLPCFWQKLTEGRKRYDFTLTPLAGGAENEFNLFCVADPQCQNTTNIARFNNETVPDIAAQVAASALPSYGITLGDIGWNTENTDYTNDVFPLMKKAMQTDKVGLPLFQVMGNHDNKVIAVSKDNYTVAHDIAAQRNFEYIFGPVNYSFDRGNVHIIAMDNIIFPSHKDYSLGFRDDQVEWLRQDLSYVSKDKMVILCVHMPMRSSGNHENRGSFSPSFLDYFPTSTGEVYYTFRQGPAYFVVLDCGEDKPDSDIRYYGLSTTDAYREQEARWLKGVVESEEYRAAPLHIVVLHMIPGGKSSWHGEQEIRRLFVPILNEASVDIMLCGHYHRYQWIDDGSRGTNFPILVNSNRDKLVVKADRRGIDIDVVNTGGEVIKRHRIDK